MADQAVESVKLRVWCAACSYLDGIEQDREEPYLARLWQTIQRRVIRTGNQSSACYADQVNYCSAAGTAEREHHEKQIE